MQCTIIYIMSCPGCILRVYNTPSRGSTARGPSGWLTTPSLFNKHTALHTHIIVYTYIIMCNTVTILKDIIMHIIITIIMSSSHIHYMYTCIYIYICYVVHNHADATCENSAATDRCQSHNRCAPAVAAGIRFRCYTRI